MIDEVKMAFGDNRLQILSGIVLFVSVFFLKGKRKVMIIPGAIISALILNSRMFDIWYEYNDRAYWRLLWILPIVPVCSIFPAFIMERVEKDSIKFIIVVTSIVIISFCGRFIYDGENSSFVEAKNSDKLPEDVVAVAEVLLNLEDEPYVVCDSDISQYIRQYSGKIKTLYTRDVVYGGSTSKIAEETYQNLTNENGDLNVVLKNMINHDYEYLVTKNIEDKKRERINEAGFDLIEQVNDYGIYRALGNRTEIRTYNYLHQVTSVTNVDTKGRIITNKDGYATIRYEYSENFDHMLISKTTENTLGEPINCYEGYATVKYTKSGDSSYPFEYYYDQTGMIIEMGSGFFHEYLRSIDLDHQVIFIVVRDDVSECLTMPLVEDLKSLGSKINLKGKYRSSYYGIISSHEVIEEWSREPLFYNGFFESTEYSLVSKGYLVGDYCSIIINGIEYSPNSRGFNIVLYDTIEKKVIDSVAFDTNVTKIPVTKHDIFQ